MVHLNLLDIRPLPPEGVLNRTIVLAHSDAVEAVAFNSSKGLALNQSPFVSAGTGHH